ncbi:MAG: CocE/NonD family hydrolase [Candidatus Caldarchaeum sp.]
MTSENPVSYDSVTPPPYYDRQPSFEKIIVERDVMIPMRDGVRLAADIYRPDTHDKVPALLSIAVYNKDLQSLDLVDSLPPQPAWSSLWTGCIEAGDTRFFVSRGYAHVIANPRGVGKSEDGPGGGMDLYDLIEWIAAQAWCDGNVGMIGISGFARYQWIAAELNPPHLKAIFPYDPAEAYPFADWYPGGVLHTFRYLISGYSVVHERRGAPQPLSDCMEEAWKEALNNPDYKMYPNIYNIITMKGQIMPKFFEELIYPFEKEENIRKTEERFQRIKVPTYTGTGWYSYTYKEHVLGAVNWYSNIKCPKKLIFTGPSHLERPFSALHGEILRWFDYWLKGIDTGVMNEPPIKIWVMGANKWYVAMDWPLPETEWVKFYLHSWERLTPMPFPKSSRIDDEEPDVFVQMPLKKTRTVQRLRYMTDPLAKDMLIIGPIALYLYASIDQNDTNWIVILKDVGPDYSVQTAREGERNVPFDLKERELTRGWLKASYRYADPNKSKPYYPWHPLTKDTWGPVVPNEIYEYAINILPTANLFKVGHRICLEIMSMDVPTGVSGATNVEYIPYHICSSRTVVHRVYHSEKYPSHLLLPVIREPKGWVD